MPRIEGIPLEEAQITPIVIDYLKSIFRGIGGGLYDASVGLAHTVIEGMLHPYDNLYVPITDVLYNSIIVGAGMHGDNPMFMDGEFAILQQQIKANPKIYFDALDRVQNNALRFKEGIQASSGPQRTEMGVRAVVGIFAPGYFLKIARGFATNLEQFGTIRTPSRFPVYARHPTIEDKFPGRFEQLSVHSIKQKKLTGNYIWILNENNQLVISHYGPPSLPLHLQHHFRYIHSSLSGLKPVISAGELVTTEGNIVLINNNSGHFRTFGSHLKTVVENAFTRDGFPEAVGKFNAGNFSRFGEVPDGWVRQYPFRPSQGYGHPAAVGLGAGATAQLSRHDDADVQIDAASAYTSILPSRALLGIRSRREQQALASTVSAPSSVVTRQYDETSAYTSLLPSRTAAGMGSRPSQPLSYSAAIASASSFPQHLDTAETTTRPLVESLMPNPGTHLESFGREASQVFRPSPMQALAATSVSSRPPLVQTVQDRTPSATLSVPPPSTYISPHVPTLPTYLETFSPDTMITRPLVESLMSTAPSMSVEHFTRRDVSQIFRPNPMQVLATSVSSRPTLAQPPLVQTLQDRMPPRIGAPSTYTPHIPTTAASLGFLPQSNPLHAPNASRINLIQALQDRMKK